MHASCLHTSQQNLPSDPATKSNQMYSIITVPNYRFLQKRFVHIVHVCYLEYINNFILLHIMSCQWQLQILLFCDHYTVLWWVGGMAIAGIK